MLMVSLLGQMQRNGDELLHGARLPLLEQWLPSLAADMQTDYERLVRARYPWIVPDGTSPPAHAPAWHCPLRSAKFWGTRSPGFNPLVPDPHRAQSMFSGSAYCRPGSKRCATAGVHPYHAPVEFPGVRDFVTTDGVCYYDAHAPQHVQAQQVPAGDAQHTCSLHAHLEAVLEGRERAFAVMTPPETDCTRILDWPAAPLTYRSGERDPRGDLVNDTQPQSCALLPRVAPFALRFRTDGPVLAHDTLTTMHPGGDCHMGRATRVSSDDLSATVGTYEHCVTVARTATQASVRCTGHRSTAQRATAADRIFVFEREVRPRPLEDVVLGEAGAPLDRCDMCDAADVPTMGPDDRPLDAAETSLGVLQRISAERILARELHRVCDASPGCRIREGLFVRVFSVFSGPLAVCLMRVCVRVCADLWQKETFMHTLVADMGSLLLGGARSRANRTFLDDVDDLSEEPVNDDVLWDVPWCVRGPLCALSAGNELGALVCMYVRAGCCITTASLWEPPIAIAGAKVVGVSVDVPSTPPSRRTPLRPLFGRSRSVMLRGPCKISVPLCAMPVPISRLPIASLVMATARSWLRTTLPRRYTLFCVECFSSVRYAC